VGTLPSIHVHPLLEVVQVSSNTSNRPCPYCEAAGCEDCSFTGQRVTTTIEVDGEPMVVRGNAPLSDEDVAALVAVGRAAIAQMDAERKAEHGAPDDL
jgi:hypothetical protein